MSDKKVSVKFRIWINSDDLKLLGKGRVELLILIDELGSISKAALTMKMSYRQAWQMVSEMNERANEPFVDKRMGGKSGGGAILTPAGKRAIDEFSRFETRVYDFILSESKKLSL